jgi:hypothetical protein
MSSPLLAKSVVGDWPLTILGRSASGALGDGY